MARKNRQPARAQRRRPGNRTPAKLQDEMEAAELLPAAVGPASIGVPRQSVAGAESGPADTAVRRSKREVRPYGASRRPSSGPAARVSMPTIATLDKEQEYAFIRADLRRLLVTAGILTVVMISLLMVIDV